ncbi:MAG: response regulator [Phenylobacterium sp.]|uniref:response regulator n=1 Tax=Phenylobacterium sp. TaxID=1871053 RepID=UPI0025EE7C12|nr:response regulator transcription factor [Phenylobacterium sp.]MBI1200414.1 response regulator [Phenylobacterium sp.]
MQKQGQKDRRILVADDNREIARRVAELLNEQEHISVVGPARDGLEAVELYEAERPDTVVLDFDMPGLTGLEVLQRIRARDEACLIIILTAHSERGLRDRCLAEGADHFLSKSSDMDQLVDIVVTRR